MTDDKYWEALAERWEALRKAGKVRWAAGMRRLGTHSLVGYPVRPMDVYKQGWWCLAPDGNEVNRAGVNLRPDLRDPATVGVLLSQWREACGDAGAATFMRDFGRWETGWRDDTIGWFEYRRTEGETEAEAIIAALEALEER